MSPTAHSNCCASVIGGCSGSGRWKKVRVPTVNVVFQCDTLTSNSWVKSDGCFRNKNLRLRANIASRLSICLNLWVFRMLNDRHSHAYVNGAKGLKWFAGNKNWSNFYCQLLESCCVLTQQLSRLSNYYNNVNKAKATLKVRNDPILYNHLITYG
jgi:hypothetical protein